MTEREVSVRIYLSMYVCMYVSIIYLSDNQAIKTSWDYVRP